MKIIVPALMLMSCAAGALAEDRCPPIKQSTLLLPSDQLYMRKYFIDKAREINKAGRCVVSGGYDRAHNLFYYAVNDTDDPTQVTVLKFNFKQLSNSNINR